MTAKASWIRQKGGYRPPALAAYSKPDICFVCESLGDTAT